MSSVATAIMITNSNASVKRNGRPNQSLGLDWHTIAISGLSRVRTELAPLLITPFLAPHQSGVLSFELSSRQLENDWNAY
jgi:hypothetical protein